MKPKNTGKQEKQKMAIGIGCGGVGVGGLVMWGGVMAIATLASVSAIKLRRKRLANKSHHPAPPPSTDVPNKLESKDYNDDQGKGLDVLLQDSSPPVDYHPSRDGITNTFATQIDSTALDLTKSLDLDDNPEVDASRQYEKPTHLDSLSCDNSKTRSSSLVIDYGVNVQECSLPVFGRPENVNKNESPQDQLDEVMAEAEGKAIVAPHADQFAQEKHPQMQLIGKGKGKGQEEEDEEHHVGENIEEIGKEVIESAIEGDLEVTEVVREDKAAEAPHAGQIKAEDNLHMQSIGEEQENDHAETNIEKGEQEIETTQKDRFEVEVDLDAIKVMKEDEAIVAPDAPQIEAEDRLIEEEQEYDDGGNTVQKDEEAVETVEGDSHVMLGEKEDYENDIDEEEEETLGKGEESSEGTGDSSMESNTEAICPVESVEKLEKKIDEHRTVETEEHSRYESVKNGKIYAHGHHDNEDTGKLITSSSTRNIKELPMQIDNVSTDDTVSTDSSNLRILIWSTSMLLLLLLLAATYSLLP